MSESYLKTFFGFFVGLSQFTTYFAIIGILFICGLGVPIPEDITLILAGILSALGQISFAGALVAGFVGVLIGDSLLFFIGKKFGEKVFEWKFFKKLFSQKRLEKAKKQVVTNSKFICFTARFLPGLRAPIYLTSGAMGVKYRVFFLLDGLAALLSVPIWVWLGNYVGRNLDLAEKYLKEGQLYILSAVAIFIVLYVLYKWKTKKSSNE